MQIYGFLAQVEYQSVKHKYHNAGLKLKIINKIDLEWKEKTSEKKQACDILASEANQNRQRALVIF